MKAQYRFGVCVSLLLVTWLGSCFGNTPSELSFQSQKEKQLAPQVRNLKSKMLSQLDMIVDVFEVRYAPFMWKRQAGIWELQRAYLQAKSEIEKLEWPSIKEYHIILKRFFKATRDYHVGIIFHSTEKATLPFTMRSAEGHYYVVHVDRSRSRIPLSVGDEILLIDGKPVEQVIRESRKDLSWNNEPTDLALAELAFTNKRGEVADEIPQGDILFVVRRKKTNQIESVTLTWNYQPERIKDLSKVNLLATITVPQAPTLETESEWDYLFDKKMIYLDADLCDLKENTYTLGNRNGFLPILGERLWESKDNNPFQAYIFARDDLPGLANKCIGYVRISSYRGTAEETEEFKEIIELFEEETDLLIINQLNNPGGSLFYLYSLASIIANQPLTVPKHHILLTQEEVHRAAKLLIEIEKITSDEKARDCFGDNIGGFPVNYGFVKKLKGFCTEVIASWEKGALYTDLLPLFGIDIVNPNPSIHYTKPILFLINELDFSGADFMPAILQDNRRAIIFGKQTAGAGGYFMKTQVPNQLGINYFHFTASIAERKSGKNIENVGVTPDIAYEVTENDLTDDYSEYAEVLLAILDQLGQYI